MSTRIMKSLKVVDYNSVSVVLHMSSQRQASSINDPDDDCLSLMMTFLEQGS